MKSVLKKADLEKEKELFYKKVKKQLSLLNYNYKYIGTKLLIACIYEIYYTGEIYNINLTKDIYPIISKKYNKSIIDIKCTINYATTMMYCETPGTSLTNFFGFKMIDKPKSKDIMLEVVRKLNNKK